MKFEDALKELKAGDCEGIVPHDWIICDDFYIICGWALRYIEGGIPHAVNISVGQYLGEWKLVNPVVRPKPGEVWEFENGERCFIIQRYRTKKGLPNRSWQNGE